MLEHILKFAGLLFLMFVMAYIPFGMFVNTAIVLYGFWKITE